MGESGIETKESDFLLASSPFRPEINIEGITIILPVLKDVQDA
jgi:hypothetical protein